jgi:Kef-type K+ transport system membrane component KefB
MIKSGANFLAQAGHLNLLLLLGIAIFGGFVGAKIFKKLKIPQIVGYVFIGVVLGPILNLITHDTIELLGPFNVFALGIIGFLVGGELKREILVNFGKRVIASRCFS